LAEVAREAQRQHEKAFQEIPLNGHTLEVYGNTSTAKMESCICSIPEQFIFLQKACATTITSPLEIQQLIDDQSERMATCAV